MRVEQEKIKSTVSTSLRVFIEDEQGLTVIENVLIIFVAVVIALAVFAFWGNTIAPGFYNKVKQLLGIS